MKSMKMSNSTSEFFLDNPWKLIDKPCYPNGRRLYLHDERFWVSMDETNQILFFVQDKGADKVKPLENLAGLNISIEKYGDGESRLVCRLTSQEPGLAEKFATVAKDIAFHCSAYQGSHLFIKTQERIKSWANFLKPSRVGLTHSEFIGFFGELYVLSEHLMPVLSPSDSIRAWIGPEEKKQDFTFGNSAVEVKTTISGDKQTVQISSLDQLDKVTDKLYLLRVIATPTRDGSGFSLGELYENCLNAIGHDVVAEGLFLQKTSALYGKASENQVKDNYLIVNITTYEVDDHFPKLTRSDVDMAISGVKYEISVGALSDSEVTSTIGDIVNND